MIAEWPNKAVNRSGSRRIYRITLVVAGDSGNLKV